MAMVGSSPRSFLPVLSHFSHAALVSGRMVVPTRFSSSRMDSPNLANFSQSFSLPSRSFLSCGFAMRELMWRSSGKLDDGRDGACTRVVKSETSGVETVEGKIEGLVGSGNGSNGGGGSGGGGNGGGGGEALGWISSVLVFALYAVFVYYAAAVAPAQTPYRDQYFIEKLVGLRSDDGFVMNTILKCEFFIMGLWPIIYSSLLIPSAKNEKGGVPAWPFLIFSFAAGAFALVPYFGLWQPPPPKVTREELSKFPLNVLENKLVAYLVLLSGAGLLLTAAVAEADQWTEMYQYFRESKFIHVMSIDFLTLSSLAPFWVYNDMATRKWLDKGTALLPLSLVPFLGPALYLVFRPPLPLSMVEEES
ncbi:uncharacterized protein [Physcomitrium patens]|uniref:Cardiolipin synthase N-terminal domain-containing protein n=1 Tax=Physcomitrium patens TaxID=3218 RepID=A0A2K1IJL6_PHYPA|nr:uncharacterized protein LOC112275911 [Physcomitrium patens]PNR29474.1 hypothetical protein PHYPA_028167 [Physcomitrium patens]|eukprot:XP_024362437.1 uncharacterized protein LOC112275911 [Physcomitrella patens]